MTLGIRVLRLQLHGKSRRSWLALLAAIAPFLFAFSDRSVAALTVLYAFSPTEFPQATNSDGAAPNSKLVLAADGFFYGTTLRGGAGGAGTIFRLSLTGNLATLYSFPPATNGAGEVVYDISPNDLAQGSDGNFYGTTQGGGSNFSGTIFAISPSGSFTNLHTFAAETLNSSGRETSADGASPIGALAQGADGNFYGTTQYGGANGTGTIFRITPGGEFTSPYSFSPSSAGSAGTNGSVPNPLVLGTGGVFYATTQQGGLENAGAFFKYTVAGAFSQVYSFNGSSPSNNPVTPDSALAQGANGFFYGASAFGGLQGGGSIFSVSNAGGATVLHSFPQLQAGAGVTLTLGADGNFYGTTAANGLNSEGTLFRITPSGEFGSYTFSPLTTNGVNAGGANPSAALAADNAGNLYGSCEAGGPNGSGVIFQIFGPDFNPLFFLAATNSPPGVTNVAVGSSVALSYSAQGSSPLSYQWLRNGTNLTDGGDLSGSATGALVINPVLPADVGSYALTVSNTWGAVTSSITTITVEPPGISISSPAPNARTNSPIFAGTATNAPLFAGANPNENRLTNVFFSITNLLNGSNIAGTTGLTAGNGGVYNWSFTATPFPGTNVLSVRCEDASGNISPAVSRTFFYVVSAPLTVLTTGSGAGKFSIPNGTMLNLGETYSVTARPISSVFSNWTGGGVLSYESTLPFLMQSNLVLTADFLSRQPPAVSISFPAPNARTGVTNFFGKAGSSPLLPGVNPANVQLTNVLYWLTNAATDSVLTGMATLTSGVGASNWSIALTPLPGTNTLAVQSQDVSGGASPLVSRTFFYKAPALFTLLTAGNGHGTFTAITTVAGDTVPTNGAMLNIGQSYTITARPLPLSTFGKWVTSAGASSSQPTLSFVMQPGFALTATFVEIPPIVAISSPAPNFRSTTVPSFNGTASGQFPITNVACSLADSSGSATLTTGTGTVSNWSIALSPSPGPNTLTVYCTDVNGNRSATVSRKFFYEVPARLTVTATGTGNGTFRGAAAPGGAIPADGALLDVGESYRITALPGASSLFSNWAGNAGIGGDTPALSFVMESNLVLTATFVTNFFPAVAGTYNGLFFPAAVAAETSGMLSDLALRKSGAFSGKLLMDGTNYHFATNFNASGHAAFLAGPLQVALALDTAIPEITGTVTSPAWTASLTAEWAANALPSSEYTILLSPSSDVSANSPPGDGYVLATNHAGLVTLTGALADGTRYSQIVPVSQSGDIPIYDSLYQNAVPGLLLGWINLTNLQTAGASLTWIKKTSSSALYAGGFTNILSVQGAVWTDPPAISLTDGILVISNSDLFLNFTNVAVHNNTLTNGGVFPTNSLSGSINPNTGLLTLTFADGNGHATTASAALLQNTTNAGGFFLTRTNAGSVTLQP